MAPKRTTFKAFEIEQKIGVNIEFNINPDFLFDLKELSMESFLGAIEVERVYTHVDITPQKRIEIWPK